MRHGQNKGVMDERVQRARRAQSLQMDAEQLDRQDSMARRDNKRVENRLRLEKGSLENHQSTNMYSLNYEMKRLKRELKGIKQTSGHFDLGSSKVSRANRRVRGEKRARGYSKANVATDNGFDGVANQPVTRRNGENKCEEPGSRKSGLVLPVLCGNSANKSAGTASKQGTSFLVNTADVCSNAAPSPRARVDAALDTVQNEEPDTDRGNHPSTETETVSKSKGISINKSGDSPGIGTLKMDAAKERIQNRLSTTTNPIESDYTQFMHVPPDGLPRTVYLLPPLQDLLREAKKARYIRRPKGSMGRDDPERELDIDEIFGKKG